VKKFALLLACLAVTALVAGCSSPGTSAEPPADFKVVAGDGSVVLTWTAEEGVDYWIFYGLGTGITTENWANTGGRVATKARSPYVLTGLTNGLTYSFTINGRRDGGPGGPGAPTQVAQPRLSGATWTPGTPLGTGTLNAVASGILAPGVLKTIVGTGGAIYNAVGLTSTDYTPAANPVPAADLNTLLYATSGLLAAGAGGVALTSNDGTTWTAQSTGYTNDFHGGASAGFGYLLVGSGGIILASQTGVSWVAQASATTNTLYAAGYGNNLYVAVGAAGTIVTSPDAATWTIAAPVTSRNLRGVTYGSWTNAAAETVSLWVAVGDEGTFLTSTNGTTWTAQAPFTTANLAAVTYSGQFLTVGSRGTIYTSADASAWVSRSSLTTADLKAVARTPTGYIVVGSNGTNLSSN
jgi:hypothetical protein